MKKNTNQTRKVIISGYSGFVGQHLAKIFEESNIEVIPLPRSLLHDKFQLEDFLSQYNISYIFSLHAYGNMFHQQDEDETVMANYFATWNLLQASKKINYKALVYISTSSVLLPYQTFYSATKRGAEYLIRAYQDKYKKPIVICRPYTLYGEGEADCRLIPTIFRSCLTGEPMTLSSGVHDFVYVKDFVKYLISLAEVAGMPEIETIHEFGSGKATSNEEIVAIIEEITGKEANITEKKELRPFDNNEWYAKYPSKNLTSLEEGLLETYDYYEEKYQK